MSPRIARGGVSMIIMTIVRPRCDDVSVCRRVAAWQACMSATSDKFANLADCCKGGKPKPTPSSVRHTKRSWTAMVAVALLPPNDVIEEGDGTSEGRLGRPGTDWRTDAEVISRRQSQIEDRMMKEPNNSSSMNWTSAVGSAGTKTNPPSPTLIDSLYLFPC